MTARGAGQQGESCSRVNDYLRVKFFAAIVDWPDPRVSTSRLFSAPIFRALSATNWKSVKACLSPPILTDIINVPTEVTMAVC